MAAIQLATKGLQYQFLNQGSQDDGSYIYTKFNKFSPSVQTHWSHQFEERVQFGKTWTCKIQKKGDFLLKTYLKLTVASIPVTGNHSYIGWCNGVGRAIIDRCRLYLGELLVQDENGMSMFLRDELQRLDREHTSRDELMNFASNALQLQTSASTERTFYVPLDFFFSKSEKYALPLLAYNGPVRVELDTRKFEDLIVYDGTTAIATPKIIDAAIVCEYLIVEPQIKDAFMRKSLEYVMEQVQITKFDLPQTEKSFDLEFNHPVRYLVVAAQENASISNNDYFFFSNRLSLDKLIDKIRFTIDHVERFDITDESYFRNVTTLQHLGGIPQKHIYYLPFDPSTSSYQGYLNFSQLHAPVLHLRQNTLQPLTIHVMAVNINVLRFKMGQASIAYLI